jgi:Lipase maturation factor
MDFSLSHEVRMHVAIPSFFVCYCSKGGCVCTMHCWYDYANVAMLCFSSFRLDWQMWIASACRTIDRSPWMFSFLLKLLEQDPGVTRLLAKDPFQQEVIQHNNDQEDGNAKNPPVSPKPNYIRILLYRYNFHKPKPGEVDPPYWDRQLIGRVYPRIGVATIASLQDAIRNRPSLQ